MLWARIQDAREIWGPDDSRYPQGSPVRGWLGFWLRVKCSICILFGWEYRGSSFAHVPVWIGPMWVTGYDCHWPEIGVPLGWRDWTFARYRNGI